MTVNRSAFTDWGRKGIGALKSWARSSPNLLQILWFVVSCWGGGSLGIYGVRPIRGGTTLSTHSFGAALDWSYRGLGSTPAERRARAAPVIAWLIANSVELGVQAIHDYLNCRIWHSTHPGDGWKAQTPDKYGMGCSWGDWLHIETFEGGWFMDAPVAARLGATVAEPAPSIVDPVRVPSAVPRPVLTFDSTGPLVVAVQTILREQAKQDVGLSDGHFGARTRAGWRNFAAWYSLPADDRIDGTDWDFLAVADKGWQRLYDAGFPKGS